MISNTKNYLLSFFFRQKHYFIRFNHNYYQQTNKKTDYFQNKSKDKKNNKQKIDEKAEQPTDEFDFHELDIELDKNNCSCLIL